MTTNIGRETYSRKQRGPTIPIAYIVSMKRGLPSFVYREIDLLTQNGIDVVLYVTKNGRGSYMPKASWPVVKMASVEVLTHQVLALFRFGRRYLCELLTALRTATLLHFLVAVHYSMDMVTRCAHSVHCIEGLHSLYVGFYCSKLCGIPLTVTVYADSLYISPKPKLFPIALTHCQKVFTVCKYNQDLLVSKFNLDPAKIAVYFPPLNFADFAPKDAITILIVAQYAERKGHDILLQAIKTLGRADLHLWIVGGPGGDRHVVDVPGIVQSLGLESQVTIFGNLPEEAVRLLYRNCDIFCLPSRFAVVAEGTPVALMEAMANGKPVISTRHAGIPEYVDEILVEENDIVGLAKAIEYLASNPEIRRAQGMRNLKIIRDKFSERAPEELIKYFKQTTQ